MSSVSSVLVLFTNRQIPRRVTATTCQPQRNGERSSEQIALAKRLSGRLNAFLFCRSNLLGNLLWFYEAQRSGRLPSDNRVAWRNDSALNDGLDYGVDLTGGYYDAGGKRFCARWGRAERTEPNHCPDYIKATYPLAYTLFSVCWGANVYGAGYDNANQTAYLDGMLRWGLDWLMKVRSKPYERVSTETLPRVGSPGRGRHICSSRRWSVRQIAFVRRWTYATKFVSDAVDNNYWGGDQDIPGPRPAWQVNSTVYVPRHIWRGRPLIILTCGLRRTGTDISSRVAAAFASCSILYNGFSLSPSTSKPAQLPNSTYASLLLTHASQVYSLSQQTPFQTYTTAMPDVDWPYASSSYQDDQALASVLMSIAIEAGGSAIPGASSPQSYLDNASTIWSSNKLNKDVVFNWDSVSPAVPVLMTQVASLSNSDLQPSGGKSNWQTEAEKYFDRVVQGKGTGYLTKGNLLFYEGDSDLASLNPAMTAAMLLFMYGPLASNSEKIGSYKVSSVAYYLTVRLSGIQPSSAICTNTVGLRSREESHVRPIHSRQQSEQSDQSTRRQVKWRQ